VFLSFDLDMALSGSLGIGSLSGVSWACLDEKAGDDQSKTSESSPKLGLALQIGFGAFALRALISRRRT
jgi:hypothetical protein